MKIYEYDPTFGGLYSKYEGYKRICLQEEDPGICNISNSNIISCESLYSSKLKRGIESAEILSKHGDISFKSTYLLNEIIFDMSKLLTETEYIEFGSFLVRKRFIDAFTRNELNEPLDNIHDRIEKLLFLLSIDKSKKITLVSHSFFMKIFEIYLQDKDLFTFPERIKNYFDPYKKLYNFGESFEFTLLK